MAVTTPVEAPRLAQPRADRRSPVAPPFPGALDPDWQREVRDLARRRNAIVLAHNYVPAQVQDVADSVGDSLALSRVAASSDAEVIVFCGVRFMAETAKILAPGKTVLLPEPAAGCSLADTIDADQLRAWKAEHPGAVVVAYVNTSAEVKAEADICCTSSNAADVVRSVPADREILFLPDQFLGAHVRRVTGRDLHVWMGECHVHATISPADLRERVAADPEAAVLVHPECGCTTAALYLSATGDLPAERTHVLSTGGMVEFARSTSAPHVLVATETGILHQLRALNQTTHFEPVNPSAVCRYMKMTTPESLLRSLRDGTEVIEVDPEVARRAATAVRRMIAIGSPGRGGE